MLRHFIATALQTCRLVIGYLGKLQTRKKPFLQLPHSY